MFSQYVHMLNNVTIYIVKAVAGISKHTPNQEMYHQVEIMSKSHISQWPLQD